MRTIWRALAVALSLACSAQAAPPYSGTSFIDPDIIRSNDPSSFAGLTPNGSGTRVMFDRRTNAFGNVNAYLFNAAFYDGPTVEVQVNPEFGSVAEARVVAGFYAHAIGQLPRALRERVRTVWIHKGDEAFGGGNDNILIHTGRLAAEYMQAGVLEEILMHEAVHTSLDPVYAAAAGWTAAQASDPDSISTYGRDNPTREDLAETFGPWYAARHRPDRLDPAMVNTIRQTIPARSAFLDGLQLELRPAVTDAVFTDQFWISGIGQFEGRSLVVSEATSTFGGRFGASFDPAKVGYAAWGSLRIRFTSCSTAVLEYSASDARFGSGGYALERVATPAQRRCEQVGFANTVDNEWASGAWFGGAARSGEGILIDVLDGGLGFAAWFTFGRPR